MRIRQRPQLLFMYQERENLCVVCGAAQNLQRFHVVSKSPFECTDADFELTGSSALPQTLSA